jgi:hypothetical protein
MILLILFPFCAILRSLLTGVFVSFFPRLWSNISFGNIRNFIISERTGCTIRSVSEWVGNVWSIFYLDVIIILVLGMTSLTVQNGKAHNDVRSLLLRIVRLLIIVGIRMLDLLIMISSQVCDGSTQPALGDLISQLFGFVRQAQTL